jgi:hypothetical protein
MPCSIFSVLVSMNESSNLLAVGSGKKSTKNKQRIQMNKMAVSHVPDPELPVSRAGLFGPF